MEAAEVCLNTANTARIVPSRRLVKAIESFVPSKRSTGRPLASPGTSCGRLASVVCTRSLPLPDWSAQLETVAPSVVTPESERTQSSSPGASSGTGVSVSRKLPVEMELGW